MTRATLYRSSWICAVFCLWSVAAGAQTPVTVSGTITTRADGLSVPNATVSLVGSSVTATTDNAGRYVIEIPPAFARAGRIQLRVEGLGLPARTHDVDLVPNGPTIFDVSLSLGFEELVTVGSRTRGAEAEKAVPVDIITQEEIASTGYAETAQVIQSLAPSFNFPRPTITDGTDTVRPATLRGLGPDQVLVLVNGKRRHQSALVHLNGSIGRGSTGVDLNAIPVAAIERHRLDPRRCLFVGDAGMVSAANFNRNGWWSTMKMRAAPSMRAQAAAIRPTGPAPKIAKVEPAPTRALTTAW